MRKENAMFHQIMQTNVQFEKALAKLSVISHRIHHLTALMLMSATSQPSSSEQTLASIVRTYRSFSKDADTNTQNTTDGYNNLVGYEQRKLTNTTQHALPKH